MFLIFFVVESFWNVNSDIFALLFWFFRFSFFALFLSFHWIPVVMISLCSDCICFVFFTWKWASLHERREIVVLKKIHSNKTKQNRTFSHFVWFTTWAVPATGGSTELSGPYFSWECNLSFSFLEKIYIHIFRRICCFVIAMPTMVPSSFVISLFFLNKTNDKKNKMISLRFIYVELSNKNGTNNGEWV